MCSYGGEELEEGKGSGLTPALEKNIRLEGVLKPTWLSDRITCKGSQCQVLVASPGGTFFEPLDRCCMYVFDIVELSRLRDQ